MVATVTRGGGSGRGRRTINEINMVPFIDVMLVLLIIFMVTAPLISPSVKQADKVIQVIISKTGKLDLKSDVTTVPIKGIAIENIANLVQKAQNNDVKIPVVISADKAVKYESVVEVMDKLQRAGIQRVGLSVQLAK
jgi:biopolymer transport protein TolR